MKLELYTKNNCSTCTYTKKILREKNIIFTEHVVGVNVQRETVLGQFPQVKLLPIVVIDGEYIGTKEQLFQYIAMHGDPNGESKS